MTPAQTARRKIRVGEYKGHTAGCAPGHVQGNVVMLPERYAEEFQRYCENNPKPCPLLSVANAGEFELTSLGTDIDIRTDVPAYRVFRNGALVDELQDIRPCWRDDLVTFILGCSYSFEEALQQAGLSLRHIEQDTAVPMYRSSIETLPAGKFSGPMVVSMRPFTPGDAQRAHEITARYPRVHGAPIHTGDPATIGIGDLSHPDYGEPVAIREHEIPVFWACGVTPQVAVENAKPEFCITHAPGAMLITDLKNKDYVVDG